MVRTRSNSDLQYSPDPELLIRRIKRARRSENSEERKNASIKPSKVESRKEENNLSGRSLFECHICIEVAKEPVVTFCGHLFCWSCLYQWLYQLPDYHKDCPVCKGKVSEATLIPIYGSADPEAEIEKKNEEEEQQHIEIPPRPKGKRAGNSMHEYQSSLSRQPEVRGVDVWMQITHGGPFIRYND